MPYEWINVTSRLSPLNRPVLVSDGRQWAEGYRMQSGGYVTNKNIEVVYWKDVELPPLPPYVAADGAVIIPLSGRSPDLREIVVPGDQLWSSGYSDLTREDKPYLTFTELSEGACVFKLNSINKEFITDWEGIRDLLFRMDYQTCYIRRK